MSQGRAFPAGSRFLLGRQALLILDGCLWMLAGSVGGSLWLWRSGWVPAEAAAVICTALGGALALAGVLFWVALVRARRRAARGEEHVPDGNPRSETE